MTIKLENVKVQNAHEVYKDFSSRKDIFPHIRKDYVERMCAQGSVIRCKGVSIIFYQYKRRVSLGNTYASKGNYILHQIINTGQGNGMASRVFDAWISTLDSDLFLTVRANNMSARRFYKRKGFQKVGDISWAKGTVPGIVYRLKILP